MARVRYYETSKGDKVEVNDLQKRVWVAILYPDNKDHEQAIERLKNDHDSLLICHNRSLDPDTGELKKPHYHVLINRTLWLFSILDLLQLPLSDHHLFHGLREFYSSVEEAEEYFLHLNDTDKEQYDSDEFEGGLKEKAKEYISTVDMSKTEMFYKIIEYITEFRYKELYLDYLTFWRGIRSRSLTQVAMSKFYIFKALIEEQNGNLKKSNVDNNN